MIKIVCPECQSDEIVETKEEAFDEWFKCESCGKEFTFQEAQWERE